MLLTKVDILQSAMIDCIIVVDCKNGKKIEGVIKSVSDTTLKLLVEKENVISLLWDEILVLTISDDLTEKNSKESYQWWKQQQNIASKTKFSLTTCYRSLYDKIAQLSTNVLMSALFSAVNPKRILMLDSAESEKCLHLAGHLANQLKVSPIENVAIKSLIYLASKEYAVGIDRLIDDISCSEDDHRLLPLICFYQDMSDSAGAFYWASSYFDEVNIIIENNLWWNYLLQAVTFEYYDELIPQLLHIYDVSPKFAFQSLSFLFFARNDFYKGSLLYKESQKPNGISKEQYNVHLYSLQYGRMYGEHYSYYARYRRWVSLILDEETDLYQSYDLDTGLNGFVYDYVPSQGYCKVVGLDLLSYFLYFDNCNVMDANNTKSIRSKLQKEICSMSSIEDELPVCIEFCRIGGLDLKRSYAITRAELTKQISKS